MNIRKMKKGLTLIELIISLALLGIIIVPIGGYALASIKNGLEAEKKQKASFIGQRLLEEIKAYDEIGLEPPGENKAYFQLLDGEKIEKIEKREVIVEGEKTIEDEKFVGSFEKDELTVDIELIKDKTFEYNNINNLENITGETFTLNLRESVPMISLEKKKNLETEETEESLAKVFSNNLVVILEENLKITINDSLTEEKIIDDISDKNLKNIVIINIEKSFSSNKTIEIRNKTTGIMNVYVVKDNESTGKVNVSATEGKVFINDGIDLYEENIEGKKFNYSVKVKDKKDKIIFEGSSSSHLNFKIKEGGS